MDVSAGRLPQPDPRSLWPLLWLLSLGPLCRDILRGYLEIGNQTGYFCLFGLGLRHTKDRGGMNGRRDGPVFSRKDLAAVLCEAKLQPQQILGGGRSEADNHLRLHGLNLHFEPGAAGRYFEGIRLFVEPHLAPWFPLEMLHCIGDVHFTAIDSGGLQAFIQEQPGRPDKRPALLIFTISGLLSYQKQVSVNPALAENGLGSSQIQIATVTLRGCHFEAAKTVVVGQVLQGRLGVGANRLIARLGCNLDQGKRPNC